MLPGTLRFRASSAVAPLNDPAVIDVIEPLEEAVVRDLALKLGERPIAAFGLGSESIRQSTAERCSRLVSCALPLRLCLIHRSCPAPELSASPADCMVVRASSIHAAPSGSSTRLRNHLSRAKPSFRRKPNRVACGPSLSAIDRGRGQPRIVAASEVSIRRRRCLPIGRRRV
jgi:hypothetical protein